MPWTNFGKRATTGFGVLRHEIIVIGSGYGGSIASSRLARAGKGVTVLERGRRDSPGRVSLRGGDRPSEPADLTAWGADL